MCPGVLTLTCEQDLGTLEALCPDEVLSPCPWVAGLSGGGGRVGMFVLTGLWVRFRLALKVLPVTPAWEVEVGLGVQGQQGLHSKSEVSPGSVSGN